MGIPLLEGDVQSDPAIGPDGAIYVASADHNLYAINPECTQEWAFSLGSLMQILPRLAGTYLSMSAGTIQTVTRACVHSILMAQRSGPYP